MQIWPAYRPLPLLEYLVCGRHTVCSAGHEGILYWVTPRVYLSPFQESRLVCSFYLLYLSSWSLKMADWGTAGYWIKERRLSSYHLCPGIRALACFLVTRPAISVKLHGFGTLSLQTSHVSGMLTYLFTCLLQACFFITPSVCALSCSCLWASCTLPVRWWDRSHASLCLVCSVLSVSLLCCLRPLLLYLWKETNKPYLAGL